MVRNVLDGISNKKLKRNNLRKEKLTRIHDVTLEIYMFNSLNGGCPYACVLLKIEVENLKMVKRKSRAVLVASYIKRLDQTT